MEPPPRLDLHVHTGRSRDGHGTVLDCAEAAVRAGLQGFAVTDHNSTDAHRQIKRAAERTGLTIVPGAEISTTQGHLLALGVAGKVPAAPSMAAAIEWVEGQGGVPVPSHPLRLWTGIGPTDLRELVANARLEAVEVENARDRRTVRRNVARLATELGLGGTGGSDAHYPDEVGTCWTRFDAAVDNVEDVLEGLRRGLTKGEGGTVSQRRLWKHRAEMLRKRF